MATLGRYEILNKLGQGGMGVVYRAFDPVLQRSLAIKAIKAVGDPEYSVRLVSEAQSAAKLLDPRIVTIYDVGKDGDTLYIAMELLEGRSLDAAFASSHPMSGSVFLRLLADVAGALDYAHSQGIVHRDVKPSNIMVLTSGGVKIMDFGIAKSAARAHLTQTGTILGTPLYMAPEQIKGETVDGRSDQFSLAVVAYEGLTGRKPFESDSVPQIFYSIINTKFESASVLNPILGPEADRVLAKALAADPNDRYPSCAAFAEDLSAALAGLSEWGLPARRQSAESLAGRRVEFATQAPGPVARVCSVCGSSNPIDVAFCQQCGARLATGEPSPYATAPLPPSSTAAPSPPAYPLAPAPPPPSLPNVTALAAAAPTRFLDDLPRTGFFSGEQMRFSKIEESFRFFRDNLQKQYESLSRQADVVWKLWAICVGLGFLVLIAGLAAMFLSDGKGTVTKGTVTAAGTVLVYYIQRLFQHREDVYRRAAEEKNNHLEYGNKWLLVIQTVDAIQDSGERRKQQARIAEALTNQLAKGRSPTSKTGKKKITGKSKKFSAGA
jgi:serine/threonine-protein kinase